MTKKDYELIAEAIKSSLALALLIDPSNEQYQYGIKGYHWSLTKTLARELENNNAKFDYNKFVQACGIESGYIKDHSDPRLNKF